MLVLILSESPEVSSIPEPTSQIVRLFVSFFLPLFFLVGCIPVKESKNLSTDAFLSALEQNEIRVVSLPREKKPELLLKKSSSYSLQGLFSSSEFSFAVYELSPNSVYATDENETLSVLSNQNLLLVSKEKPSQQVASIFLSLQPPLTLSDAGVFIYPLGFCCFLSAFVMMERFLSLRRSITFPRKVEKALRRGEFPNKKWKQNSCAERIVWVAINEQPSTESLKAYAKLETSSLERGLFILEFVIAAAPLIGLLGTVTGLVQVFSVMPSLSDGKDALAEGIGLALLTTILGLAIAIPTLVGYSYLSRVIEKRVISLNWVTSRINDAINPQDGLKEKF